MRKVIFSFLAVVWFFLFLSKPVLGAEADQAKIIEEAKKEGKLVYYTSMTLNDSSTLVNKFAEKYPFIKPEVYRISGGNLLNKILMEARANKFIPDVISEAVKTVHTLKKEKYLGQFRSIETAAIPANLKDPDGSWTSVYLITHVLGYNTRMVATSDVPKSYAELLAPKWKGKISMDEGDFEWFACQLQIMGQEKGVDFMKKLAAQNPRYADGHNLQTQLLAAAEFPVAVNLYGHSVETMKAEGGPVEWVPIEPVVVTLHGLALSAKAPHPNAARLFMDFALSKEGQGLIRGFHRIPSRLDVEPDPPRLMRGLKIFPFSPALAERLNDFVEQFRQIFIKQK